MLPTQRADRRGFTLLELMAALTLAALALGGARILVVQLADGAQRVRDESVHDAARVNGMRMLRQLVLHAERFDSTSRLAGTPTAATFDSWCLRSDLLLSPCRVGIELETVSDTGLVAASIPQGRLTLLRAGAPAAFVYFEIGRGWLREWTNDLALPTAIGVATKADTLVLPVGGRT
jgi:prepilin-type N-terminal cleavage/methylation domain-containing protein